METKKRILICDDVWQVSRVVGLYVKTFYDCECITEQDPWRMLQRAAELAFDLILLDSRLNCSFQAITGGESGRDLAGSIRSSEKNKETPIAAVTTRTVIYGAPATVQLMEYPNGEFWDDLRKRGFTDAIEKPFFHEQLESVLKKYEFAKKDVATITIPESIFEPVNPFVYVIDTVLNSAGVTLHGTDTFAVRYFRKSTECIEEYRDSYFHVSGVVINTKTDADWKDTLKALMDISVVPKIIVAGDADTIQDAVIAAKLGATAYIGWPRNEREFTETVSKFMESPLLESDIERREQWIGQRCMTGEELLKRFFSIMVKDNRACHGRNLLSAYRDTYKGGGGDSITIGDVTACIEGYLGKKISYLQKGKLLLVEDDAESLRMTVLCFERYFEIVTAKDGNETLDRLKMHDDIDLILLDVHLPGKNADEIYDEINRLKGKAQVIVLTAYPELKGLNHFIKRKAYQYLQKPYEPEYLFRQMGLAWLNRIWRHAETGVNIHDLPFSKRLYFLNELLCKKERQKEVVYGNDVYSLFPEVFR